MEWARLSKAIVDRRVELGFRTRESLATATGLSSRLLGDLEHARRDNYDPATYARLEQALEWPSGRVRQILRESPSTPAYTIDRATGRKITPSGRILEPVEDDLLFLLDPAQSPLTASERAHLLAGLAGVVQLAVNLAARATEPPSDLTGHTVDEVEALVNLPKVRGHREDVAH